MFFKNHLILIFFLILTNNSYGSLRRDLSFLEKNQIIRLEKKGFFSDNLGRSILFNSAEIGIKEDLSPEKFKPFLKNLKKKFGTNLIKLPLLWEKINPGTDYIDYHYLNQITQDIKMATELDMFVFISMDQDKFSRFIKGGSHGAPAWVVNGLGFSLVDCQNKCTTYKEIGKEVKVALTSFWKNEPLNTTFGKRFIQSEYIWNLKKTIQYFKSNLNEKELNHILGIDPWSNLHPGNIPELQWKEVYLTSFMQEISKVFEEIEFPSKSLVLSFSANDFLKFTDFFDNFKDIIFNPIVKNVFSSKLIKPKEEKQIEEISKIFESYRKMDLLFFFSNPLLDKIIFKVGQKLTPLNSFIDYSEDRPSESFFVFPEKLTGVPLTYLNNDNKNNLDEDIGLGDIKKIMILTWAACKSDFPTEIHLTDNFDVKKTSLILHNKIFSNLDRVSNKPEGIPNEIFILDNTLYIFDDTEIIADQKIFRFALIIERGENTPNLEEIRNNFLKKLEIDMAHSL